MGSSEDEIDYMSDIFLTAVKSEKEDIRPGLIKSRSELRQHEISKKKSETDEKHRIENKPHRLVEAQNREDALKNPISNDNIGFKIMQKFGFQAGTSLGKSGTGCVEPVPIEIKNDRHGLGRKAAMSERAVMKKQMRQQRKEKLMNVDDYRARLIEQANETRMKADLRKCQRVCIELDRKLDIVEPEEPWFWPENEMTEIRHSENDYDDNDDPYSNINEDEKDKIKTLTEEEEEEDDEEDEEEVDDSWEEYTVSEKVEIITHFLRNTHLYCIWCGTVFDDDKDMRENCPGPSKEEH